MTLFFGPVSSRGPSPCPHCGDRLDWSAVVNHDRVGHNDGDPGLCANCGGLFVFCMGGAAVRSPTDAEVALFDRDPVVLRLRAALAGARQLRWPWLPDTTGGP